MMLDYIHYIHKLKGVSVWFRKLIALTPIGSHLQNSTPHLDEAYREAALRRLMERPDPRVHSTASGQ